jgi:tRNA modification GTPase
VLFLHDLVRCADPGYQEADAVIAQTMAQRLPPSVPVVDVWNKSDCAGAASVPLSQADVGVRLSARTGEGLELLRQRLLEMAGWQAAPEGVCIARARHVQALQLAQHHLAEAAAQLDTSGPALDLLAEELRLAQNAVSDITGEFSSDDLLGVIFSSFCIGK